MIAVLNQNNIVRHCSRSGYCRLTELTLRMERKLMFVKHNLSRSDDTASFEIEAPIASVIGWVTDKSTWCGPGAQFMVRSGSLIRKA